MIVPIRGSDSPHEWEDDREEERGFKGHGAQLFRKVSDLYFFCMAKDVVEPADRSIYTTLSKIMQISKHSALYGDYIGDTIEKNASDMISELKESLQSGKIPRQAISIRLKNILNLLIEDSRKARLMMTLTELEMLFIHPQSKATEEEKKVFREKMTAIVERLTPETDDIQAEAINRDLQHFLSEEFSPSKILQELTLCFERWLK